MKIIFFGTPDYVLPVLESLHRAFKTKRDGTPIVAVVTQKPKPTGRKHKLEYSAVDKWAHKRQIPVYYQSIEVVLNDVKADVGILASYGEIIPTDVLNFFPHGILNIHPSVLPKFRGASPVQATILAGEEPGVSIIKLDEKMDHGPIISQFKDAVSDTDTTDSLRSRLFQQSAGVLTALLPAYVKGKISPRAQDHEKATYTKLVKKADGFIPPESLKHTLKGESFKGAWKIPFIKDYSLVPNASSLERFIRAMQPWPVAWTEVQLNPKSPEGERVPYGAGKAQNPKRLKILKAHLEQQKPNAYCLVPDIVQLEGKNPVTWSQFTQGYPNYNF